LTTFAAVDIGASGGRVVRGTVDDDGTVVLEPVHRFTNGVVERDGHLRWDLDRLEREMRDGLSLVPDATSIGIDTWGVDYGLLDEDRRVLADPIAYRDDRTTKVLDRVHALVSPAELYAITGIQHLPFNTIYQLVADDRLPDAHHAVLLPDLLAFGLTGWLGTELTNASTTALVDAGTRRWSTDLLDRLGIPTTLLPPIEPPGTRRGTFGDIPVVTVGSHDTASAVAGVPMSAPNSAYIVSGTWSLVGVLADAPIRSDAARAANFTNEIAADGRIRFLRNVGGLWLLQECLREWGRSDLDALLDAAALVRGAPLVDVDDASFIAPGDMPARIAAAAGAALDEAATVRCILESLAAGYARTLRDAAALTGRDVDVVHVVGGGSQNALLCELTAGACGRPVVAGPVEATALGNVLVQARAAGLDPHVDTTELGRYEPS
jgi:rhamnulokinase